LKDKDNVGAIVSLSKDHRVEIDKGSKNVSRKIVLFDESNDTLNEDDYIGVVEQLENDEKKHNARNNTTTLLDDVKRTSYGSIGSIGRTLQYDEVDEENPESKF
jgi:hypothetical protein